MPGPLDAITKSVIPQSWIQPAQDYLEEPQLDQSPAIARLKGFGSGALQGLRDFASPINIAGVMAPPMRGAMTAVAPAMKAGRAMEGLLPAAGEAIPAAFGEAAWAGRAVQPKNWAQELQQAKDLISGMGSEAGKIDAGAAIGGGLAGGAALYGLPKIKDAVGSVYQGMKDTMSPFSAATDALHGAMDKVRRR